MKNNNPRSYKKEIFIVDSLITNFLDGNDSTWNGPEFVSLLNSLSEDRRDLVLNYIIKYLVDDYRMNIRDLSEYYGRYGNTYQLDFDIYESIRIENERIKTCIVRFNKFRSN